MPTIAPPEPRLSLSNALNVLRWLTWDTFRQAIAARVFWVMLVVSATAVLFCASVGIRGGRVQRLPDEPTEYLPRGSGIDQKESERQGVFEIQGEMMLAFGAVHVPHARDADDSVHFLQLVLASGVAGTLGVLLTLVGTAGFLPSFLEPQAASVLLTKPVPRWLLLLGKYLGMIAFVTLQATIFVVSTWFTLGVVTNVWTEAYLLSIPLLVIQFAFFYGFSMFLAVSTRSTIICIIGTVLFWMLCNAVNSARIEFLLDPDAPALLRWPLEAAYWILPKPIDFNLLLIQSLHAEHHFATWPALKVFESQGRALPELSILTSLVFAVVMVAISALDVGKVDY
jgi:ABC-type transport system involved in multi-copper enzyme maturation permease subunit